ncbi:MAG: short-chain dehydrogenase [Rhodobacteraceae bacterium]|nr:short-chain dehydrogenase [Paracoccaceae bacterium]
MTDPIYRAGLFDGARILVTGGGSGLGRAMATRLAGLGAEVILCGRRAALLEETAAAIRDAGGRATALPLDIRDPDAVEAAMDAAFADGPLTGLVNNAGANFISRTEDLSIRAVDAVTGITMRGTFLVTHAVGKRWIKGGNGGAVISILSTRLRSGAPFSTPSTMGKAAIESMTKSLASEWGGHGIRLNAIAPGEIPTEGMLARLRPGEKPGAAPAAINPLGRAGTLEDIGSLAAFLLGPGSAWINGETLYMDGGQTNAAGVASYKLREWGDADWEKARGVAKSKNAEDKAKR